MAACPPLKIDEDIFDDNMSGGMYELDNFRFVRKTWKELISSGQYNQFGDVELRQLIDLIVEKQDLMKARVENLTVYTRDIVDSWLTKNYDMWRIQALNRVDTQQQTDIPKSIGDIDVEAILSDRTFRNILAYRRLFVTQYLSDCSEMHADYKLLQKTLAVKLIALEEWAYVPEIYMMPVINIWCSQLSFGYELTLSAIHNSVAIASRWRVVKQVNNKYLGQS